jgi:hypothetical protein
MKKIFVRSPYFIEINESGQVGSKIELRFRKAGGSYTTPANYVLSKKIASPTQTNTIYNISNYAKEFIKPITPGTVATAPESTDIWCFMEVKRYKEDPAGVYTLLNTEEFVCLDGYTNYSNGYNQATTASVVPLFNPNINIQRSGNVYVNIYFDAGDYELDFGDLITQIINVANPTIYKILVNSNQVLIYQGASIVATIDSTLICEPKYTPQLVTFINRFGGWQPLTFFKAKSEAYEMQSVKHKLMPEFINYNTSVGQYKQFNFNGKQSIKLNTGYVPENYSELMKDLLLSETILLGGKPVTIKSQNLQIKSTLVDKLINYEIEFEYNYNLINTVQ